MPIDHKLSKMPPGLKDAKIFAKKVAPKKN